MPDAKSAAGVASFSEIEAEASGFGLAALKVTDRRTARAVAAWSRLEDAIARIVPTPAQPSTGRVRNVLEALRKTTARYVPPEAEAALPRTEPDIEPAAEPGTARGGADPVRPGAGLWWPPTATASSTRSCGSPPCFGSTSPTRRSASPWKRRCGAPGSLGLTCCANSSPTLLHGPTWSHRSGCGRRTRVRPRAGTSRSRP